MRNQEIAALWKLGMWALRAWWRCQKLEHLCETDDQGSMYSFIGATARFGGATACYRLLRPHLKLLGGVLHFKDLPSFASQSEILYILEVAATAKTHDVFSKVGYIVVVYIVYSVVCSCCENVALWTQSSGSDCAIIKVEILNSRLCSRLILESEERAGFREFQPEAQPQQQAAPYMFYISWCVYCIVWYDFIVCSCYTS